MRKDLVLANRAGKLVDGSPRTDRRNPRTHSGTDYVDNVKGALTDDGMELRCPRV